MTNGQIEFMRKWLNESGYGLELRVAHGLRSHGGSVAQSVAYTDPVEEKLREGDVFHMREVEMESGSTARVMTIIECKSSKKAPWAVFDRESSAPKGSPSRQALVVAQDPALRDQVNELAADSDLFNFPWFGMSLAAARQAEDPDGINPAHRAVRQVLSATYGASQLYRRLPGVNIYLPAVVTSAPIMTCRLNADTNQIEIRPTEYAQIRATPENNDKRSLIVHVMSEGYAINDFATATEALASRLGRIIDPTAPPSP